MPFRSMLFLAAVLTTVPAALSAQLPVPLVFGGHVGAAFPTGDITSSSPGVEAGVGPSFGGVVGIEPIAGLGVFAMYEQARFACGDCGTLGLEDEVVLKAIGGGLRATLPLELTRFTPWLEGSLFRQILGFSGPEGEFTSEAALGFTVGAGVTIPIVPHLELSPRIRYLAAPAEFDFSTLPDRDLDAGAILLDLGLGIRL